MRSETGQPVLLADYRPPDYLIEHVELDVSLGLAATRVRARLTIRPNPLGRPGAPLVLDGDELVATHLAIDNAEIDLASGLATPQSLTIETPPQRRFTLSVETVVDPSANTKLMGLFRSGAAYCTQCEAEGFRRITYFLDRPDVLSTYVTRIEAERAEAPVLLGNGDLTASGDVAGTSRHYAVWSDPHPKPCYLFAMVGGDLGHISDTFTTMSGREVALGIYVERGKEARAAYAMDSLKRSMRWDEKVFKREYDLGVFNIVAVSDFNMGAMENKGLNVFNDKLVLASPETATDADYAAIEAVIAHEYFHNWTGNRITCRDWFQLCLKEGLTVFRDQEFSSDERSRAVKRIADVRGLRAIQFAEDASPLAHNVRPASYREINNFYTATVYEKGAEVIRMLKLLIGDAAFADGMQLYFERFDGTAATIEDFLSCFAESSKRDLTQFKRWYEQAGTPELTVAQHYDEGARRLTLTFSQETKATPGQPLKEPFVIPVALGLVARGGGEVALAAEPAGALDGHVLTLSGARQSVSFGNLAQRPAVSLLRGFSAPVKLHSAASDDDLFTLLAHDPDSFNRWQAAQTLATRMLLAAAGAGAAPDAAETARYAASIAPLVSAAADGSGVDHAFIAQILAGPGEGDLARDKGHDVDPQAIHRVRKSFTAMLGAALAPDLARLCDRLAESGPYSPDAASAGRRSLRNAALTHLVAASRGEEARAARQFEHARNMTDQLAALSALAIHPGAARDRALAQFYARHESEPLIVDKWFTLQASIPEDGTLDAVKRLMAHPAFSLGNPNRVRALVGAFATMNLSQFNRADGAGYAFVADTAVGLDARNPQVAARLLGAFRAWRTMEPKRRELARQALLSVTAAPGLSNDMREIADRLVA